MKTATVILKAGEYPHSVDMAVQVGIVTDFHYHITQLQAKHILRSLYRAWYNVVVDEKSDKFILKLLGV